MSRLVCAKRRGWPIESTVFYTCSLLFFVHLEGVNKIKAQGLSQTFVKCLLGREGREGEQVRGSQAEGGEGVLAGTGLPDFCSVAMGSQALRTAQR